MIEGGFQLWIDVYDYNEHKSRDLQIRSQGPFPRNPEK